MCSKKLLVWLVVKTLWSIIFLTREIIVTNTLFSCYFVYTSDTFLHKGDHKPDPTVEQDWFNK